MIRTQAKPNCQVCGTAGRTVHTGVEDMLWKTPGQWNFRECVNPRCATLWLDPAPLQEDIGEAYRFYFTHGDKGVGSSPPRWLQSAYRAVTSIPHRLIGLRQAEARLNAMFLDDLPPSRLLDVGCGDGRFLLQMRQLGWDTCGVDFDAKAIEIIRQRHGLDVRAGELASHHFPDDTFDALTMSHVIEHVFDPVALLTEARRILKPNGRLIATTPNNQSLGRQMFQTSWFGMDPPRHIQLFSPKSLAECARKAGFAHPKAISSAGRAEVFIAGSFKLRGIPARTQGRVSFDNILPCRTFRTFLLQCKEQLALRRNPECGEEIVLICHK
jgi:ubiquinone/menaquinone biosynthesis C-methylase UbiE